MTVMFIAGCLVGACVTFTVIACLLIRAKAEGRNV